MLAIRHLNLSIHKTPLLHDISLSLEKGQIMGVVGESGSGKSLTALAAMQLLPHGSRASGSITLGDQEVLNCDDRVMQTIRGNKISMIFQEPMTALNPVHTVGAQVAEGMILHGQYTAQEAFERTKVLLARVGLGADHDALGKYPHQLSGGQRQRVMIAMACALSPDFLIADEPTTALDVTLQAQILTLLRELVEEHNMGLLLISHDLAVIAEMSDRVTILRAGKMVEQGPTGPILRACKHPYTRQLAQASVHRPAQLVPPVFSAEQAAQKAQPLLEVKGVIRTYQKPRKSLFQKGGVLRAVAGVNFNLYPGQFMGLVGESGCGKSTLARMILGLDKPTQGTLSFKGVPLHPPAPYGDKMKAVGRHMQVVFQDPFASFNPRHRVERLVAEPLFLQNGVTDEQKRAKVIAVLKDVGLDESALERYPHEFSGGQRQRLAIARALITRPALIIADEPVSALDVSIRAQVLDLLVHLRERFQLSYLFISHDLGVVRAICDEVMVMEKGRIVEQGPVDNVFNAPQSKAAQNLVQSVPNLEQALSRRLDLEK